MGHPFNENTTTLIIEAIAVLILLAYFYYRKKSSEAPDSRTIQRIEIKLLGSLTPSEVRVQAGRPAQLYISRFDEDPKEELFEIEALGIYEVLPALNTTIIAFTPERHGRFPMVLGGVRTAGLMIVE
jgi:plastocyanin domain-containing protein